MLNFISEGIIWVFAIYGFIEIIKTIYYICTYTKLESEGIYFIVAVKNQEEKIEGFLRSILFRIIYGKEEFIKDIITIDLDSKDKTREIIEKLSSDYNNIKLMEWKECKNLIENIKNSSKI